MPICNARSSAALAGIENGLLRGELAGIRIQPGIDLRGLD